MKPPAIEREFGVPFPGDLVDAAHWTRTALKQMPVEGRLNWAELFGRSAPVVLDVGCGNGRFLIGSALARKDHDHLGIDTLPVVIRYARRRGSHRGLANIRFAVGGGLELIRDYVEPGSVAEIHCYHPQPFYRAELVHHRMITPSFLATVHQSLSTGGMFVIQTDNPGYWKYIQCVVPVFFDFETRNGPWPDAPRGRTRREIIALRKKLPIFRGIGRAKANLSYGEALKLAEALPTPTFSADRRLRELDLLDCG